MALLLVSLLSAFGETRTSENKPFNCNMYLDFVMEEYICRPMDLFVTYSWNNGKLTGIELLEELKSKCSNTSAIESYFQCMADLEVICPEQYPVIIKAVEMNVGTFCNGTNVQTGLMAMIQRGFTYNIACKSLSSQLLETCNNEIPAYDMSWDMLLSTALEIIPPTYATLFECMKTKFSLASDSFEECGSTWRDMLLTWWLWILAISGFPLLLGDTDGELQEQLTALQLQRVEQ